MVLRVDKEKGYIDLSKRRVSPEDVAACEERFSKSKMVHSIVRHVAETTGQDVEELYKCIAWPLYKAYGHAFDAFKVGTAARLARSTVQNLPLYQCANFFHMFVWPLCTAMLHPALASCLLQGFTVYPRKRIIETSSAIDVFPHAQTMVSDPDAVLLKLQNDFNDGKPIEVLNEGVRDAIIKNVKRRMTPQPLKIRADVELTCFSYDGVLHIQVGACRFC